MSLILQKIKHNAVLLAHLPVYTRKYPYGTTLFIQELLDYGTNCSRFYSMFASSENVEYSMLWVQSIGMISIVTLLDR